MDDELYPAKPEAWFPVIQAGAREHESTAQIWERIRNYADERSLSIPSDMWSQVNRMRGIASGLTYASERLTGADSGQAITEGMIGTQIYQRGSEELQKLAALYHVRFELVTATLGGEQKTEWKNLDYGGSLPATVGELQDDLDAYGQGLSDGYGETFLGVGRIEIGAY